MCLVFVLCTSIPAHDFNSYISQDPLKRSAGGSRYSQFKSERSQSQAFWVSKVSVPSSVYAVPLNQFIQELDIAGPPQLRTSRAFSPSRNQMSHMKLQAGLQIDTIHGVTKCCHLILIKLCHLKGEQKQFSKQNSSSSQKTPLSALPFLC